MHSPLNNEKIIQDQIDDIILTIVKTRKKKRINQAELSKMTGVSRSTISRLENFLLVPTLPVILSIFKALDITFDVNVIS